MLVLDTTQVRLGQQAADKSAALALLADWLVADGLVTPGYLQGLQAREAQGSTYLGQGIALPHGTPQSRDQVLRTGVRLMQFPDGVDWGDGQRVYLAIVIAARSDEHLRLLQLLARALGEGDLAPALREARSAQAIIDLLQGEPPALQLDAGLVQLAVAAEDFEALAWQAARLPPEWPTRRVPLGNAHGLHARPAKVLAGLAQAFPGEVRVRLAGDPGAGVSAKSLSKLLGLGAQRGQTLEFLAEPAIAEDALPALERAVREGLGEALAPLPAGDAALLASPAAGAVAPPPGTLLRGVGAAPGIAIGPALVRGPLRLEYPQQGRGARVEAQRLEQALRQAEADLQRQIDDSREASIGEILATHQAMLRDPVLRAEVVARLEQGLSAEAAWVAEVEAAAQRQQALHDARLAERAADLRDIGRRVLARLCGAEGLREPEQPYVLVMDEVGPSDIAGLDRTRVAGILTARGGATSHSAIVARALGIPAVVGVGDAVLALASGTLLLLDGDHGLLCVAPDPATLLQAREARAVLHRRQAEAEARRLAPAVTRDGQVVKVYANLGNSRDAAAAVAQGAEGIGLLRTELLFMAHPQAPDQATQEAEYRRVIAALGGRPLVVRTLDVGGDKPLPYLPLPAEENPFLGVRGIRLSLQRPEWLETQLRALFAAAGASPLRVMFPMVGRVEEWRAARDLAWRVREAQPVADLQLGIMVEVPSAALLAETLAREVDFFSLGTNDLTQYVLAIDRGHPSLSVHADGLHPAVLRLIDMTVQAAHAHGKWVGVCGELAGDAAAVPLLIGLGVDELSVAVRSIARIKARVRELQGARCRALAAQALTLDSAPAVRALLEETL